MLPVLILAYTIVYFSQVKEYRDITLVHGFHLQGHLVLKHACLSSSHHVHIPESRKEEASSESFPGIFHSYLIGLI